jgi:DNA-directed RNA polymerase subunit RPC12/RpoP
MTAKADLSQKRETGMEQAETDCPSCGKKVPVVETAYGSTTPGACTKCWPAVSKSQLKAQQKAAEEAAAPLADQDQPAS